MDIYQYGLSRVEKALCSIGIYIEVLTESRNNTLTPPGKINLSLVKLIYIYRTV